MKRTSSKRAPVADLGRVGIATEALYRRHERALRELARRRAETLPIVFESLCDYVDRELTYKRSGLFPSAPDALIGALKVYAGRRAEVDEPPWLARIRQLVAEYEAAQARATKRDAPRPRAAAADVFTIK